MREIKFRYFVESKPVFVSLSEIIEEIGFEYSMRDSVLGLTNADVDSDGLKVINEFAGVKDASGVDIYEGDIVLHTRDNQERVEVVEWSDGNYCFDMKLSHCVMDQEIGCSLDKTFVIGNIYLNADLLE